MKDIFKFIFFPNHKNTEKVLNKTEKQENIISIKVLIISIIFIIILGSFSDEYVKFGFENKINFNIFIVFIYILIYFILTIINNFSLRLVGLKVPFQKSFYIIIVLVFGAIIFGVIEGIIEILFEFLKINIPIKLIEKIINIYFLILSLILIRFLTKSSLKTILFFIIQVIIAFMIFIIISISEKFLLKIIDINIII